MEEPIKPRNPRALARGKTPHERAHDKEEQSLTWIYRWGFTTPATLEILMKLPRSAVAKLVDRLVDRERLRVIPSPSSFGFWRYEVIDGKRRRTGPYLLVLTDVGAAMASNLSPRPHAYELNPNRLNADKVRHDLLCQRAVAGLMASGEYANYFPESYINSWSESGIKQPDCILLKNLPPPAGAPDAKPAQRRTALEIELTPKNGRRLDQALSRVGELLSKGQIQKVMYLMASKWAAEAYAERWSKPIQRWTKDSRGHWVEDGTDDFNKVRQAVTFIHDKELMADPI